MISVAMAAFVLCVAEPLVGSAAAVQLLRPGQEYRSLNTDTYAIVIQKNGRLDVSLADGSAVFENAFPMVWFEGKGAPELLAVAGRSSERFEVRDALGQGHGMRLLKDETVWSLHAYPTETYFSVQVAYRNTSRNPVRVRALLPWCIGKPKEGVFTLGPGSGQSVFIAYPAPEASNTSTGETVSSAWYLAAWNPVSKRSFVAGFLGNVRSETTLNVAEETDGGFGFFRAACIYDPPLWVQPGERLESEVLYLAVGERNPSDGLLRFGNAVAAANGVGERRAFLPHGWDSAKSRYGTAIDEGILLRELDAMSELKRYGWSHFEIGDGWQSKGRWTPDEERFPHGMGWMANEAHNRGMTAGLWMDPFTAPSDSALVREHGEWFVPFAAEDAPVWGPEMRVLDPTAPGALAYLKNLGKTAGPDWGFDALTLGPSVAALLKADRFSAGNLTKVEVLRAAVAAIHDAFGSEKWVTAEWTHPALAGLVEGVGPMGETGSMWGADSVWGLTGFVESARLVSRQHFLSSALWSQQVGSAYFGVLDENRGVGRYIGLSFRQSVTWATAAVLSGGVVRIASDFSSLEAHERALLTGLLPSPKRPARPVDLFSTSVPKIWLLPLESEAGRWDIVGVFNWDDTLRQQTRLDFSALGLQDTSYYTVYDYWQDRYYGTARGHLDIAVAPGGVRLFGLRRYLNRPMLLSSGRHFAQGAGDVSAISWDAGARVLKGVLDAIGGTEYTLSVLTPEPFEVQSVSVSSEAADWVMENRVARIRIYANRAESIPWEVTF